MATRAAGGKAQGAGGAGGAGAAIVRPRSVVPPLTALTGLCSCLLGIWLFGGLDAPAYQRVVYAVAFMAAAMVLVEVGVYRVHRNPSSGLAAGTVNRLDLHRLLRKLVGLGATLGTIAGLYWLFPEYQGSFYAPFWQALKWLAPVLLISVPAYLLFVDLRQKEPEDSYARLGTLILTGRAPDDLAPLWNHARTWLIKGFFLPLMYVYLVRDLDRFWGALDALMLGHFMAWYEILFSFSYIVDLAFTVVGYTLTLRLLDAHVRSAEPTMFGWAVCIICYQPFWSFISDQYLAYETDGIYWGPLLAGWPLLQTLWGVAILALTGIYVWATVCFGIRFSNLTNRGVITIGPYRYTKHPAYVAKNLSWWLISVPFISGAGWEEAVRHCALLAFVNIVYALRAWTEERHMAATDPTYPAYQAYIRAHGLFAPLRRLVRSR